VQMKYYSDRSITLTAEQTWHTPAGGNDYVEIPGTLRGRDMTMTWQIANEIDQAGLGPEDYLRRFMNLWETADGRPVNDVMQWRDGRGRVYYVRWNGSPVIRDNTRGPAKYTVTFALRRVAYTPV